MKKPFFLIALAFVLVSACSLNGNKSSAFNTYYDPAFGEQITNSIEDFKADYEGENTEIGGQATVVNENAVILEIDWLKAKTLLESENDVFILFSAPWCPYCKVFNGILTDAAAKADTPIYYVNIETHPRTEYVTELSDGQWSVKCKETHDDYEEFLSELLSKTDDEFVPNKVLSSPGGEQYDTGIKYVSVPMFIRISNKDNAQYITKFALKAQDYDIGNGIGNDTEKNMLEKALRNFFANIEVN